jgi:hypothetical protein
MRLMVEVIIIGGRLPGFLGAFCSGSIFYMPGVSMSKPVLIGAKKLQINTTFGGNLTAADVGTSLVDFLAVCDVLLRYVSCFSSLLRNSPGPLMSLRFCSLHHFVHSSSGQSSVHSVLLRTHHKTH